jgi:FkbM family methyltransferase
MRLAIDVRDYPSCMMLYGRFSQEIVALIDGIVQPGEVAIDVGAQLGYLTTVLARDVGPRGRVYSFEPDPNALVKLRVAIAANELAQVTLLAMAASDREGELLFNVSPTLGWSTAVQNTHLTDLHQIQVPTTTIDRLRAQHRITGPVALMKIDVEGLEGAVLDGAQSLIAEDRPVIILEINPVLLAPTGQTSVDLLRRVVRHDYVVHRIVQPRGLFSGGRVELEEADVNTPLPVCDVVCVAREKSPLVKPYLRGPRPSRRVGDEGSWTAVGDFRATHAGA